MRIMPSTIASVTSIAAMIFLARRINASIIRAELEDKEKINCLKKQDNEMNGKNPLHPNFFCPDTI